jgi:hypothetical protein
MSHTIVNPDPIVMVSTDTHIGPRLREDLRRCCPRKYLRAYDDYIGERWWAPLAATRTRIVERPIGRDRNDDTFVMRIERGRITEGQKQFDSSYAFEKITGPGS